MLIYINMARVKIIHEHNEDNNQVYKIRSKSQSSIDYSEPKLLAKPELEKQRQLAIAEREQSEIEEKKKNKLRVSWDMSVGRHFAAIIMFLIMFIAPVSILENWQQIQFAIGVNNQPFSESIVSQSSSTSNSNTNNSTGRVAGIQTSNSVQSSNDSQTFFSRLQSRMGLILIVIGLGLLSISAVIYLNVMGVI
jgi:hypothetical protein